MESSATQIPRSLGHALEDEYHYPASESMSTTTIPDGSIFVLGDNRDYSSDSRDFGSIQINAIRGKMIFVVY